MSLSFNLQRLPAEALNVLRYLGTHGAAATPQEMEQNLALSPRAIGRGIRRLVNYSLIQIDYNGAYQLTSNGRRAFQQLGEMDAATFLEEDQSGITRRLTVVLPQAPITTQPITLFVGINPATDESSRLAQPAQVELRLSAIGGKLSKTGLSLDVPPDRAAPPATITLTAEPGARLVRVRLDAFQIRDLDQVDAVGNMYFDVPVVGSATDNNPGKPAQRAFGTDLSLRQ